MIPSPSSLATLLLAVVVGGLTGCDKPAAASKQPDVQTRGKPVRVVTLGRDDIADVLVYVAHLLPHNEVKIYSPVPDRILEFPWQNGDEIAVGERVALIRKEGIDKGIDGIRAQIAALDVQLENLASEVKRAKELLDAGAITRQAYDQVRTQYRATRAQRRALKANKAQLRVNASNALIEAPITGVVADKMAEPGDIAVPQLPLCRILMVDKLKVHLKLVEADVNKVRPEQDVEVTVDCCPGQPFVGKVTRIFPYLDMQTRTNTVEVVLANPKDPKTGRRRLKPGMYGRAELVVGMKTQVVVAPEPALLLDSQLLKQQAEGEVLRKAFVVGAEGDRVEQRLVRLGARKGAMLEVLEGLSDGERVVIRGQHGLKDGQAVEIADGDE